MVLLFPSAKNSQRYYTLRNKYRWLQEAWKIIRYGKRAKVLKVNQIGRRRAEGRNKNSGEKIVLWFKQERFQKTLVKETS